MKTRIIKAKELKKIHILLGILAIFSSLTGIFVYESFAAGGTGGSCSDIGYKIIPGSPGSIVLLRDGDGCAIQSPETLRKEIAIFGYCKKIGSYSGALQVFIPIGSTGERTGFITNGETNIENLSLGDCLRTPGEGEGEGEL